MENLFLSAIGWISDNRFWILPGMLVYVLLQVALEIAGAFRRAQAEIEEEGRGHGAPGFATSWLRRGK